MQKYFHYEVESNPLVVHSPFAPAGDQPEAIDKICQEIKEGAPATVLLGVTGSGKTYTMAKVIEKLQRPTLVLAHNKTLAGQLCSVFMSLFPDNAVEYFVSYYDYYQPESYIPSRDLYIEKDSAINDEIDRLRHSATASLMERRDVIVVATVSCIYGIGNPESYSKLMVHLRPGEQRSMEDVMADLVAIQYKRNDFEVQRGCFRVRGDVLDIFPPSSDEVITRVYFWGDEIEKINEVDFLTGKIICGRNYSQIYPASLYATEANKLQIAVGHILEELDDRLSVLQSEGKIVEAYRLEQRTRYDCEMLLETGFCKGIENYSRHMDGRKPGEPPYTLMDFFPDDYLLFIDESHATIPQFRAMYNGDHSRKEALIDYGFRLPSAFDNRPLQFAEFEQKMGQTLFVSATPGPYEMEKTQAVVEQLIRPTGLPDPLVEVRPILDQIPDLTAEIDANIARNERTLVLTLTKKMSEDLTSYFQDQGYKVAYLHSEVKTVERLEILQQLREGVFDIVVGINLLREGLDLPEVSLIAILDADKEGFLRSETALIQIIGRAARNIRGRVILYADTITRSMKAAMDETERRRQIQIQFNKDHNITPKSVQKELREIKDTGFKVAEEDPEYAAEKAVAKAKQGGKKKGKKGAKVFAELNPQERAQMLQRLRKQMEAAAKRLDFEEAALLRDELIELAGSADL